MSIRFHATGRGSRVGPRCAAIALALAAMAASAAAPTPDAGTSALARYRAERAACEAGRTGQDRATCLREAGAALDAARHGALATDDSKLMANALRRCQAQTNPDDRRDCEARVRGQGSASGSVAGGGILRETVTTIVGTPPAPAAVAPPAEPAVPPAPAR